MLVGKGRSQNGGKGGIMTEGIGKEGLAEVGGGGGGKEEFGEGEVCGKKTMLKQNIALKASQSNGILTHTQKKTSEVPISQSYTCISIKWRWSTSHPPTSGNFDMILKASLLRLHTRRSDRACEGVHASSTRLKLKQQ